jgi:hypothetical protein
MLDFPVAPPILVADTPKPRVVRSLNEARALVRDLLHVRRFVAFREMLARLDAVNTEDEAIEAIGGLRELLAMEKLLAA